MQTTTPLRSSKVPSAAPQLQRAGSCHGRQGCNRPQGVACRPRRRQRRRRIAVRRRTRPQSRRPPKSWTATCPRSARRLAQHARAPHRPSRPRQRSGMESSGGRGAAGDEATQTAESEVLKVRTPRSFTQRRCAGDVAGALRRAELPKREGSTSQVALMQSRTPSRRRLALRRTAPPRRRHQRRLSSPQAQRVRAACSALRKCSVFGRFSSRGSALCGVLSARCCAYLRVYRRRLRSVRRSVACRRG